MAESWANVKTFLSMEVPGETCAEIFVYYDKASDCSDGSGVVVKRAIKVCSI